MPSNSVEKDFAPAGAALDLFHNRTDEVVLSGPAGTGKSRACLEKLHLCALKYDGMRSLIVRKTLVSLTGTGLVTYREKVLDPLDGVKFFGGNKEEPASFRYPNGSRVVVGGLDKAMKIMSSEYDMIYVQEATELTLNDWESLTTRLRYGRMPYQQLMGDCNPDAPTHWLKQRSDTGTTVMLESRHEDNPSVTLAYLAKLDALTGVRYYRLRKGMWVAAEGVVYDEFDRAVHLIDRFDPPPDWPRTWCIDFGYTNPFVWQEWVDDPDGRTYLYREIYRTQRLVEDHAADILELTKDTPKPVKVIGDHDAEDRATFERKSGYRVVPAEKAVRSGIQAVKARLKAAGDGKPRLFIMRGALVEVDQDLADAKKPTCTIEEVDGYVWDTSNQRQGEKPVKEEPVKKDDHGMDTLRYRVADADLKNRSLMVSFI